MAQDGDTITYTFSDGTSVAEDVSSVDEMSIEYIDGAGGDTTDDGGGSGGRVANTVVDLSNYSTIYIWVAGGATGGGGSSGRYDGGNGDTLIGAGGGAGSTEISFQNTDSSDSNDEPHIAGSGGGGGNNLFYGGGARGGAGNQNDGEGVAPPAGGDGGDGANAEDGDGHVANITEVIDSGTTSLGGGSPAETDGEVKISYKTSLSPPDPPSNLNAEVQ